jgi:glutathione S-transferase
MILFHSTASPYVRKVVVTLHELGQIDAVTLKTVKTSVFDTDADLMAANPLARLPALQRDNGVTLYDSRVIMQYLNEVFGGTLYPQGSGKWEHMTLEATGEGMMDSSVSMSYEVRLRPEDQQSSAWVEAQWEKVSRALSAIETRWMSHLSGPVSAAHISVGCVLSYLDFRHGARNWRSGRPGLAEWHEAFEARPSMQATRPVD